MMKKSWKTKWLAALRSGEYKQAQSALKITSEKGKDSFCCLGVLCDITSGIKWTSHLGEGTASLKGVEMGDGSLEEAALEKYGLNHDQQSVLMTMNDNDGASFKAIAKYIEKNL